MSPAENIFLLFKWNVISVIKVLFCFMLNGNWWCESILCECDLWQQQQKKNITFSGFVSQCLSLVIVIALGLVYIFFFVLCWFSLTTNLLTHNIYLDFHLHTHRMHRIRYKAICFRHLTTNHFSVLTLFCLFLNCNHEFRNG